MNELSIIIPFFNEAENLERTLKSIRDTESAPVTIVLVNDNSDDNYPYRELAETFEALLIENEKRMGPAISREKGIATIETPFFLTIDGHMQFYKNDWHHSIVEQLKSNERSLYCCQTQVLNEEWNLEAGKPFGARINFSGPAEKLLEPEWNYEDPAPELPLIEIPCVLGATYFTSLKYWQHIRGLEGLKMYGNEEPYISLKAWVEGGGCRLLKTVSIGHVYKEVLPFTAPLTSRIYNRLLIAELLLPPKLKQNIYAKTEGEYPIEYKVAKEELIQSSNKLKELKKYYQDTFKRNINDYLFENNILKNR